MINLTICIATYNSELVLERCLKSIYRQNISDLKIEILIVDGGSSDSTINIANKYECKIINNELVEPGYAKYLGYINAKGDYLLYIDSDEIIVSNSSILKKIELLDIYKDKAVIALSSGYITDGNSNQINYYINEFGDPYSFYLYRMSKQPNFYASFLNKYFYKVKDNSIYAIYNTSNLKKEVLIEIVALSTIINLSQIKIKYPFLTNEARLTPHLYYITKEDFCYLIYMKKDEIIHTPSHSFLGYLRKIRSRVIANIYFKNKSGLHGRKLYYKNYRLKQLKIVINALLVIPIIIDALYLAITRKRVYYLIHFILFYYMFFIVIYYLSFYYFYKHKANRVYG
ncbi:glycosyltransferase family A protein [Polynucleobacter sp. MWH-UH35A]|uniref:glycosyltransferase family A protein n=1 Tax=Polynucleobacter sp. MWH-UH35A TaxID=1855619 RepID=UPI001BFE402B|nr:glycosyltransferase family 2 protein [Polynucleobacter sp. MWH-UH35A]QWD60451.1 glycosyltransferase family 2 protein [Polynucleobacter sp. MWH-UH35A]